MATWDYTGSADESTPRVRTLLDLVAAGMARVREKMQFIVSRSFGNEACDPLSIGPDDLRVQRH